MHNTDKKPDGYIDRTVRGFANRQGVSISTVYNELRSGRLKAKKIGKRTHISDEQENDWLNNLPDYVA